MTDNFSTEKKTAGTGCFRFAPHNRDHCMAFARELSVPYPLAVLLWQRGLNNRQEALKFLHPRLDDLPSPMLMKDMDRAVALVEEALRENWVIFIHGDYDVDGISGSALLARFFRMLGRKTVCFQPDRLTEGYGLQESFIRKNAPENGKTALLITVDCGIADNTEVELARDLGFKVIVTDHHLPGGNLPPAKAVLNPRRFDCCFPYPELAGVGVAFFLACGIRNSLVGRGALKRQEAPNLKRLMDLVALGTVADIMPLTGVNRILVRAGLEVMNQPDCLWALALQKYQKKYYSGPYSADDISYKFAPRINAPGRLGRPQLAFQLLCTDNPDRCFEIAEEIEQMNDHRRKLVIEASARVLMECENQNSQGASAFVVSGPFHQGIIGILAARAVDCFHRPVIVFTDDQSQPDTVRGSGRSVASVHLFEVLQSCAGSILQFGGHAMAAGLAVDKNKFDTFRKQFQDAVKRLGTEQNYENDLEIAYAAKPEELLHRDFLDQYQKLQPFGNGNPEPVFLFDNPCFVKTATVKNHLTFTVQSSDELYRGIGFGMADKIELLQNDSMRLAFTLKNTVYRGEQRVELHAQKLVARK